MVWKGIAKAMTVKGIDKNSLDHVKIKEEFSSYIKQKSKKLWAAKVMLRSDSLVGNIMVGSDLNRTPAFHDISDVVDFQSTSNVNRKYQNSMRFKSEHTVSRLQT